MKKLFLTGVTVLFLATGTAYVVAQEVAPGWRATGYWQCGPVRITTSVDRYGGMDFFVFQLTALKLGY